MAHLFSFLYSVLRPQHLRPVSFGTANFPFFIYLLMANIIYICPILNILLPTLKLRNQAKKKNMQAFELI